MGEANYYEVLEVSQRARPEVIEAAYSILSNEYKSNSRIISKLKEARDYLINKKDTISKKKDLEGKIIGNYRITQKIAEGGFGVTYKGENLRLNSPVCIKHGHYISPQDEQILIDEAKSIWDLRHFGIPSIRDLLKLEDGTLALVMSYIPGPTLEKVVKNAGGSIDPEDCAWITQRSLNVLKYLYYNGVIHGDVKPQNIIIQPDIHSLCLVDYGFSSIRPTGNEKSKGHTPYFSPPEQISGEVLLPESDIFGLGMTMLYALGGDVAKKVIPDSVPKELSSFIKKMIVRDVLSRPNWNTEPDLIDELQGIRKNVFGREHSGMKCLKGWSDNDKTKLKGGDD